MQFLIITGMSGAGKSLCVKYFEDIGYFCVDNLPPSLIPKFAEVILQGKPNIEKIALIVDIRGGAMFLDLMPALDTLSGMGIKYKILFLDAADKVLIKRFKETRRMHLLCDLGADLRGVAVDGRHLRRKTHSAAGQGESELYHRHFKPHSQAAKRRDRQSFSGGQDL
mgnify:CR=1 FL=1